MCHGSSTPLGIVCVVFSSSSCVLHGAAHYFLARKRPRSHSGGLCGCQRGNTVSVSRWTMAPPSRHHHGGYPSAVQRSRRPLGGGGLIKSRSIVGLVLAVSCVIYLGLLLCMDQWISYSSSSARHHHPPVVSLTNLLLMQNVHLRKAWVVAHHQDGMVLPPPALSSSSTSLSSTSGSADAPLLPPLSLRDLIMEKYLSSGSVNDVVQVRFRDPALAQVYGVPPTHNNETSTPLVLKMVYNTNFGHNEIV